jgi:hypothetical protein
MQQAGTPPDYTFTRAAPGTQTFSISLRVYTKVITDTTPAFIPAKPPDTIRYQDTRGVVTM